MDGSDDEAQTTLGDLTSSTTSTETEAERTSTETRETPAETDGQTAGADDADEDTATSTRTTASSRPTSNAAGPTGVSPSWERKCEVEGCPYGVSVGGSASVPSECQICGGELVKP
jgi:hypothetical protein